MILFFRKCYTLYVTCYTKMSTYFFKGTNEKGALQTGEITATSEKEAEVIIHDKGLKVLVIHEKKKDPLTLFNFSNSFPLVEKTAMCRYLALMINSGIPLGEGFDLMVEGTDNHLVKQVLQDIGSNLRQGKSLHSAFAKYPRYFNDLFLTMIKTGETSGSLANSFGYLSRTLQQEQRLKQKVLSSLLYPVIIVGLMSVIGIIVFTFVLPNLAKVFLRMNMDIPVATRMMFQFSLFLQKNLLPALGVILAGLFALAVFIKSKVGRDLFYKALNHLPFTKKILQEYNLVRFNQSLSALLSAGVPITESLELAVRSLSFVKTEKLVKVINEKLTHGLALSVVFSEMKMFPKIMTQMIAVGEKTGNLDKTLAELADFYQEEVENSLKNFTTALEPILMIIVGVAVGAMVISIISPIYSLIGKLQTAATGK